MKEIWKNIKGYDCYQVSNLGRVKSLDRIVPHWRGGTSLRKELILKPRYDGAYLMVALFKDNKALNKKIHQLVAIAFLNHTPCGYEIVVDHVDNNPLNNNVNNLQLISQRENASKDRKGGSSSYIGVSWDKQKKKWSASITIKGRKNHLGLFTNELEASKVYQNKLLSL